MSTDPNHASVRPARRSVISRWRPALRLAWRDLRRHPLRTLVVVLIVALPVGVATVASTLVTTADYDSPNSLYSTYGAADARVSVTGWPAVRNEVDLDYSFWVKARGLTRADRRDPSAVDIASLLPAGSTVTRVGAVSIPLALGGTITARVADLESPLTRGIARLGSGRAPTAADEVAITPELARAAGLLDDHDDLVEGASLATVDGSVSVTGLLPAAQSYETQALASAATTLPRADDPDSGNNGAGGTADYLVDLPGTSTAELRDLSASLAAAGVSGQFRDTAAHPRAWGLPAPPPEPVDPEAAAVGALVIGSGLVLVLVLVGAVFAIGARRQSRDLGLMMASGGTAGDLRRTVVAQGFWVGVVATALGLAGGAAVLLAGRDVLGSPFDILIVEYSVDPGALVVIGVLGVLSAVLAALIPSWGVGRMNAAQALDGHVATSARPAWAGPSRLRGPAVTLVGGGVAGLVLCGWWISRAYDGVPDNPSAVPVLLGALAAVATLLGVLLGTPLLVSWSGRRLSRGWLPWRLATRDASRHRMRTTSAVLAVAVVSTGVVLAGFAISATQAYEDPYSSYLPDGVTEVYLNPSTARDPDTSARIVDRVRTELDADQVIRFGRATSDGKPVRVAGADLQVVPAAWLDVTDVSTRSQETFLAGGVVTLGEVVDRQELPIKVGRPGKGAAIVATLPAAHSPASDSGSVFGAVISTDAAVRLGLGIRPSEMFWAHSASLSDSDVEAAITRLQLYGIDAQTDYAGEGPAASLTYAGAGGGLLLIVLVVGLIVALSASEGRDDAATLAAIGAPPWLRRASTAGQATYVGGLGAAIGLLLGVVVGSTLLQVVGTPGTPVPWSALAILVVGVPVLCAVAGWSVAPRNLTLTRRAG